MLLISFVVLYLIGSACTDPIYFAGRSGDIIIETPNSVIGNSGILLHGSPVVNNTLRSIEDIHFADLFAHVMGTQPFNVLFSREGFPKGNIFNKPKAALLITLDSIPPELYSQYSTWQDYQRVDLISHTFPTSTYTVASNLATGTQPSVHGIVGESWVMPNGEKVDAHKEAEGASLAANMADILTQEWNGASLTVSASAAASLASCFAVSQQIVRPNSFGLALSNVAFDSIYTQSAHPFSLTERDLQLIFQQTSFSSFLNANLQYSNNKITATANNHIATFDMTTSTSYSLFAELAFVYNLLNTLETNTNISSLVLDSTPDLYAFSFSSLKGIKESYGENSGVFILSLKLVDSAVQRAVAKIDQLYGRAVSAVACLNVRIGGLDEIKKAAHKYAHNYLLHEEDFERHYPALYLQSGKADQVCNQLTKEIEGPEVKVHCFTSTYNWILDEPIVQNGTTPHPPLDVAGFWILVFSGVALILVVLVGLYALTAAGTEAAKDSLLFRSTGRHHHQ